MPPEVKRVPVMFDYLAINPYFLQRLARIGHYAAEKYGSWQQYTAAPLSGEKGCINHVYEHLRQYICGEPHDKFGEDPRWHLVAAAYNLMMQFFYDGKFGRTEHPLREEGGLQALEDEKALRRVPRFKVGAVDGETEEG